MTNDPLDFIEAEDLDPDDLEWDGQPDELTENEDFEQADEYFTGWVEDGPL